MRSLPILPIRVAAAVMLAALPVSVASQAAAPQVVTRQDLADAYQLVDSLVSVRPIPAARRSDWNQRFDRTTLAFLSGDLGRTLREMHGLVAEMIGDTAAAGPTRQVLPLRIEPGQRILVTGRDRALEVSATVRYLVPGTARVPRELTVRVRDSQGAVLIRGTLVVPAAFGPGAAATITLDAAPIINGAGRYRLEASVEGTTLAIGTDIHVLGESADDIRARLLRQIAALPASVDPQDRATVRARAELITESPNSAQSAQFLASPTALAAEVGREVAALAAGRKAYELRTGDYWRVIGGPSGPIPARLFAPRAVTLGSAVPVVIALHGAGADENIFFEGYGNGRLRALADSVGFILLTPQTTPFGADAAALDSALTALERLYVIDRNAVFVIGHSMGGAAAVKLASERRAAVRAAVVVAGVGAVPANGQMSPTLFIGAGADLVIPPARVRAAYQQAVTAGALAEYQEAEGWGHTLVVGARIDDVVRWLFSR